MPAASAERSDERRDERDEFAEMLQAPEARRGDGFVVVLQGPGRHVGHVDAPASGTLMLEGEDKPLLPAAMEALSPASAVVTITEGRYHQVRRMFAALGNHVTALHRDRMGGLDLPDDLAPGGFRVLTEAEIALVLPAG